MDSLKIERLAQTLNDLLKNEDFKSAALPQPNFWEIIHYGESSYENRYNRMFAWLLDPTANHGLGSLIINGLLEQLSPGSTPLGVQKVRTHTETFVPAEVNESGESIAGRIDITVDDSARQVFVAVECKMSSNQHTEQLGRYRRWIQNEYRDYIARHFIFLTENEEEPEDNHDQFVEGEEWKSLTWAEFRLVVERVLKDVGSTCPENARFLINQFFDDQKHRKAPKLTEEVADLFEDESSESVTDVLLNAIEALDIEDAKVLSYAKRRKLSLADSKAVHEELTRAFEALGGTSTNLDRVLATSWQHRPPMVDMSKNEDTIRIIKEFAETIAGQPVQPNTEVEVEGYPRFFKSVTLSKAGQSLNLNLHDGFSIYFAGSNQNVVPSVLHHWGAVEAHPIQSGCRLGSRDVRGKLAKGHGGSGEALAENFVELLTELHDSGELECPCNRHMTGLLD